MMCHDVRNCDDVLFFYSSIYLKSFEDLWIFGVCMSCSRLLPVSSAQVPKSPGRNVTILLSSRFSQCLNPNEKTLAGPESSENWG